MAPANRDSSNRLNLADTDEEGRREAVEHHLRTIRYAGEYGIRYVVVHLGGLPRMLDEEQRLRRLYTTGRIDTDEARALQTQAHHARCATITPYLDAARRSLAELVEAADRVDVTLGLENRLHFHEIPSAEETAALLAPYPPERAGYWHDTGHAEVQARLGLIDGQATLRLLAPRLIGVHLHDVRGIRDHRAPGNGDLDWRSIADVLPPSAWRTLEIDQHEPEPLLSEALRCLVRHRVLGPPPATASPNLAAGS